MKKLIYSLSVLLSLSWLASCSSDKDDSPQEMPGESLTERTYNQADLQITYNGEALLGKEVKFVPASGKATLTLTGEKFNLSAITEGVDLDLNLPEVTTCGVLPGSPVVTLTVDLSGSSEKCDFSGAGETDFCTFSYSGSVSNDLFAIDLKEVTLKDKSFVGTWTVPALDDNVYNVARLVWNSEKQLELFPGFGLPMSSVLGMIFVLPVQDGQNVAQLFANNLKSVTFGEDGNITANYLMTTGSAAGTFVDSPKNIAQYVVANNKILLFLNPQAIAAFEAAAKTRAADIQSILTQLLTNVAPMFANGLPLSYGARLDENGEEVNDPTVKSLYLDTEVLLPILKAVSPLFQDKDFVNLIVSMVGSDPAFESMAPMIEGLLSSFPEIIDTTSRIEIGVNLKK